MNFVNFINSFKTDHNSSLIESIERGFKVCFESGDFNIDPSILTKEQLQYINNFLKIKGYDSRGIEDVKGMLERQKNNGDFFNDDWKEAVENVISKKKISQKIESPKNIKQKIGRYFGFTNNWKETGYLMQDGSQIDFSGKKQGGSPNTRALDHRDINYVGMDMIPFIQSGNIRMHPESGGFHLHVQPTPQQKNKLYEFINQFDGEVTVDMGAGGFQRNYSKGTEARKILKDIDDIFSGKEPEPESQSLTQKYH